MTTGAAAAPAATAHAHSGEAGASNPYLYRTRDGTLAWDYANGPLYCAALAAKPPTGPAT
eukprot:4254026-Alexandrium_andersonii.AAC.1